MKKAIVLLFFIFFSTHAQLPDYLFPEVNEEIEENLYSQSIFLSYEDTPSSAYVGEIFPVKVKAIITREDFDSIVTYTTNDTDFRILNPESKWVHDLNNQYFINTFYVQAVKSSSKLPNFSVELVDYDGIFLDNDELEGASIEIIPVSGDGKFSGIVAQSLAVKNEMTNKFDDKSLIVSLEIEATYSNLEEFKLKNYTNSSTVDTFKDEISLQFIEYDVIVPNYTQTIEFTYFNTISRDFQLISVPLHIKSDDVSTHTDLNPKENKFKLYKDIFFSIVLILLLVIFIFKRYKLALVGALLAAIYLFYANNPFNKIKLRSDTAIRVLPTEKSSVFHVTEGELEVEELSNKNGYIKILLPSGRIGWVREENVTKN
jgi:hypothetical protein